MPVTPAGNKPPEARVRFRPFLTRAEAATLFGMVLTVFSLFLAWEHTHPPHLDLPATLVLTMDRTHNGFGIGAQWPLTVCAVTCGASLLWTTTETTRLPIAFVQGACGLICFAIALRWFVIGNFAPLPGVLASLFGGLLLAFGAVDRYLLPSGTGGSSEPR